jgi:hypothetical protein
LQRAEGDALLQPNAATVRAPEELNLSEEAITIKPALVSIDRRIEITGKLTVAGAH